MRLVVLLIAAALAFPSSGLAQEPTGQAETLDAAKFGVSLDRIPSRIAHRFI